MKNTEEKNNIVDLNFTFTDLAGVELEDKNLSPSKVVARQLSQMVDDGSDNLLIKKYDWSYLLYENKVLELDNSDYKSFKNIVRDSLGLSDIAKAQIFQKLD